MKNAILKGTVILTLTGFLTRIIGFFYRIFLSNSIGPENMGIYQLIFPIYGICFTLYGSGFQTAISKLVAEAVGKKQSGSAKKILGAGLTFSIPIALILSILLYHNAEWVAKTILLESRCATSLRILSFVFPFCGITACINGYYYGIKKAGVPAATQLLEQVVRVGFVYFFAFLFGQGNFSVTCELAVFGIVLGELASNLYNIVSLAFIRPTDDSNKKQAVKGLGRSLLTLSVPLTGNRLLLSILNSFEAILIPSMLKQSGLETADALSIYGILTGMALPFITFPSTITNSFAVMLLPTVSEAQAANNDELIQKTTSFSIKCSLILGVFSTGIFILFGSALGTMVFHNKMAGSFLETLAWLCPFLYLSTTLGSILNGLGKTNLTFMNSIIGLSLRITFIIFYIPQKGIAGYLIGLLVSQLLISLLDFIAVFRHTKLSADTVNWLLKPILIMTFLGILMQHVYQYFAFILNGGNMLLLAAICILLLITYIIFLFITKALKVNELE